MTSLFNERVSAFAISEAVPSFLKIHFHLIRFPSIQPAELPLVFLVYFLVSAMNSYSCHLSEKCLFSHYS